MIQIAVIGAGLIGRRHVSLLAANPTCQLAAICDLSPSAARFAAEQGVPYFQRYEELLSHVPLDGAIIATPNAHHVPVGIACAERGIDLLVEKPIADTVAEANRLVEAADRYDAQILIGHYRRFNPLVQAARQIVQGGEIGRLVSVAVLWALQKPDPYFEMTWRTEAGGGPVLINLIHDIDLLRYVCGDIEQIYAMTSSSTRGFAVEDSASLTLKMTNGALGSITLSDAVPAPWSYESTTFENPYFAHAPENCAYFMGTKGSLAFPRMTLWRYENPQQSGWNHPLTNHQLTVEPADPLTAQLAHFCRVIRREEAPLVSGIEGIKTLAATLAVHESAKLGRAVWL